MCGNKAPLATGVESFRVISYYNGRKYAFDIFSHSCQSVIGKFSENGINQLHEFKNGYKYYSESTNEKNGVEIHIPVKKHNKQDFINAVKQQLLYLKHDVEFTVESGGRSNIINFKPSIIFENDDIIIPSSSQYGSPHIILSGTCYGLIDFRELELDDRRGCVGIKVTADEVDISPSRETVLWTAKTKAVLSEKFENIRKSAIQEVNNYLSSDNLMEWYVKCRKLKSGSRDGKITALYQMLNKDETNLTFKDIKFSEYLTNIFGSCIKFSYYVYDSVYKNGQYHYVIRQRANPYIMSKNIYFSDDKIDKNLMQYITESSDGYYIIKPNSRYKAVNDVINDYLCKKASFEDVINAAKNTAPDATKLTEDQFIAKTKVYNELLQDLEKLKNIEYCIIKDINEVKAPSGFIGRSNVFSNEDDLNDEVKKSRAEALKQRKANKSFPYTMILSSTTNKIELKANDIDDSYYYCFQGEENIARKITYYTDKKIGRVSKDNAKYFDEKKHIKYIFEDCNDNSCDSEKSGVLRENIISSIFRSNPGRVFFKKLDKKYEILYNIKKSLKTDCINTDDGFMNLSDDVSNYCGVKKIKMLTDEDVVLIKKVKAFYDSFDEGFKYGLRNLMDYEYVKDKNSSIYKFFENEVEQLAKKAGLW